MGCCLMRPGFSYSGVDGRVRLWRSAHEAKRLYGGSIIVFECAHAAWGQFVHMNTSYAPCHRAEVALISLEEHSREFRRLVSLSHSADMSPVESYWTSLYAHKILYAYKYQGTMDSYRNNIFWSLSESIPYRVASLGYKGGGYMILGISRVGRLYNVSFSCPTCRHPKLDCAEFLFIWRRQLLISFEARFCNWWLWGYFPGQLCMYLALFNTLVWPRVHIDLFISYDIGDTAYQLFLEQKIIIDVKFDSEYLVFPGMNHMLQNFTDRIK